jgi:hypothetical protein
MSDLFSQQVLVIDDVLVRELDGESVILDLSNENYFGLDEIGTRIWQTLVNSHTVQDAYDTLLQEYDVSPEQLRADMEELISELVNNGLVKLEEA